MNESVSHSKRKWNHDKCQCECKELNNRVFCINDCEYNTSYLIYEYLNTKNCSCEKRLIGKLVLACEYEILKTTETLIDDKK